MDIIEGEKCCRVKVDSIFMQVVLVEEEKGSRGYRGQSGGIDKSGAYR